MATSAPRIFISYRREDAADAAGRLFDGLSGRFGPDQLFMDVDILRPGDDFVEVIEQAVSSCDVLIAIIGRQWLSITDAQGRHRLDNPEDFVRLEVAAALERNIRVIPVLVQSAGMPRSDELPAALAKLARRNAHDMSHARWRHDLDQLTRAIENVLSTVTKETPGLEASTSGSETDLESVSEAMPGSAEVPPRSQASVEPVAPETAALPSDVVGTPAIPGVPPTQSWSFVHTLSHPISVENAQRVEQRARLGHGAMSTLAYSADGTRLLVGSSLGAYVLMADSLDEVGLVETESPVVSVACGSNALAAAGCADGSIWLLDVPRCAAIRRLEGHQGAVQAVALSADNRLLASGGRDWWTRIWDTYSDG